MRMVYTEYLNSYYGRLASRRLPPTNAEAPPQSRGRRSAQPSVQCRIRRQPNRFIRQLLARAIMRCAERAALRRKLGTQPQAIEEATIALVHHEKRGSATRITLMRRRAYPQFLAAGGEGLPGTFCSDLSAHLMDSIKAELSSPRSRPLHRRCALFAQESKFDHHRASGAKAGALIRFFRAPAKAPEASLGACASYVDDVGTAIRTSAGGRLFSSG